MAELATIARPYAEALFKADGVADLSALSAEVDLLAEIADNAQLRQFAGNPKANAAQVYDVFAAVVKAPLSAPAANLLRAVIENHRLSALPEIALQFNALVKARSGVSDAVIYSAYAMSAEQMSEVVAALEKRFARKLNARVVVAPELIGGIRVVVGDEVLDTSVQARLEQMKAALTA